MPTYDVIVECTSTETMRVYSVDAEGAHKVAEAGHDQVTNESGELLGGIVDRFPDGDSDRKVVAVTQYEPDTPGYMGSYGARCAYHAHVQGLDPIKATLRAAGIEHEEWQTGGFCMVIAAPMGNGDHALMSNAEYIGYGGPGTVIVQYETEQMRVEGCYGDEPEHVVTLAELPSLIRQMKEGYVR